MAQSNTNKRYRNEMSIHNTSVQVGSFPHCYSKIIHQNSIREERIIFNWIFYLFTFQMLSLLQVPYPIFPYPASMRVLPHKPTHSCLTAEPLRIQLYQDPVSKYFLALAIVSGFGICMWDGSPGGAVSGWPFLHICLTLCLLIYSHEYFVSLSKKD